VCYAEYDQPVEISGNVVFIPTPSRSQLFIPIPIPSPWFSQVLLPFPSQSHRLFPFPPAASPILHCVSKNDTGVAHYNFNAHQPILVIFGTDVAETVCYQKVICYPNSPRGSINMSFQSCCKPCLENDTVLACYIFDTYQPILIIFFADNKGGLLSTACKHIFA